uniref:Uncharacterized protein n=1 Tax=Mycena chlorophos TaxID=658473 RepID=A0ABQ0LHX2_MYCCL|nr:predicted protein [Mycena chlorophos]
MADFFFRLPTATRLEENHIISPQPYTNRKYLVNVENNLVTKIFFTGRVVAQVRDEVMGEVLILERPKIAILDEKWAELGSFLHNEIKASRPSSNTHVFDYFSCIPFTDEASNALIRVVVPPDVTTTSIECNHIADLGYSWENAPCLERDAVVRCAARFIREDIVLAHEDGVTSWRLIWALHATQICRCYNSEIRALSSSISTPSPIQGSADPDWQPKRAALTSRRDEGGADNKAENNAVGGSGIGESHVSAADWIYMKYRLERQVPVGDVNCFWKYLQVAFWHARTDYIRLTDVAEYSPPMSTPPSLEQFLIDIPRNLKLRERTVAGALEDMHHRHFVDRETNKEARLFIAGSLLAVERCEGGEYLHLAAAVSGDLRERFIDFTDELKDYMTQYRPAGWKRVYDVGTCTPLNHTSERRVVRIRRNFRTTFGRFQYDELEGFHFAEEEWKEVRMGDLLRCVVHFLREDRASTDYQDGCFAWTSTWYLEALQICRCVTAPAEERLQQRRDRRALLPEDGLMSEEVAQMFVDRQGKVLQEWMDGVVIDDVMDEDSDDMVHVPSGDSDELDAPAERN